MAGNGARTAASIRSRQNATLRSPGRLVPPLRSAHGRSNLEEEKDSLELRGRDAAVDRRVRDRKGRSRTGPRDVRRLSGSRNEGPNPSSPELLSLSDRRQLLASRTPSRKQRMKAVSRGEAAGPGAGDVDPDQAQPAQQPRHSRPCRESNPRILVPGRPRGRPGRGRGNRASGFADGGAGARTKVRPALRPGRRRPSPPVV